MHIEFRLPSGAGGAAAQHNAYRLKRDITAWANNHNTTVKSYNGPAYRLCFEFANERDYTLFALSWCVNGMWDQYTMINDV